MNLNFLQEGWKDWLKLLTNVTTFSFLLFDKVPISKLRKLYLKSFRHSWSFCWLYFLQLIWNRNSFSKMLNYIMKVFIFLYVFCYIATKCIMLSYYFHSLKFSYETLLGFIWRNKLSPETFLLRLVFQLLELLNFHFLPLCHQKF